MFEPKPNWFKKLIFKLGLHDKVVKFLIEGGGINSIIQKFCIPISIY